jgi:hypothetical protein
MFPICPEERWWFHTTQVQAKREAGGCIRAPNCESDSVALVIKFFLRTTMNYHRNVLPNEAQKAESPNARR